MRCKPCFAHHLTGSPFDCARRPWSRSFTREGPDTFQKMSLEVDERIHQLLWVNGEQSGYLLKTLKAANAPYGSVVGLTTNHQSSSRSRWRKPAADWAVATPPACWQRRHPIPRFSQRRPSFVLSRSTALVLGASVRRVSDWSVRALPQQSKRSSPADDSQRHDLDTFDFAVQVQKESNTLMGRLRKHTLFIFKIPLQHQRDSFVLQSKILAATVITVVQHKLLSKHLCEQRGGVSKRHGRRTEKLMSFHCQGFLGTRTVGDRPTAVSNESKIMKLTGRPACSASWRLRLVSPSCSIC